MNGLASVHLSVRPPVYPVFFLTLMERAAHTQRDSPGAACDANSIYFGPTIRRTDILAKERDGCRRGLIFRYLPPTRQGAPPNLTQMYFLFRPILRSRVYLPFGLPRSDCPQSDCPRSTPTSPSVSKDVVISLCRPM